MSKYIKLEDAIRKYAEMFADEAYWEHGVGNGNPDKEDLDIAREYYSDLSTYEVADLSDEAYEVGYTNGQMAERKRIVHCKDCKHGEYRRDFDNYLCDQLGLGSVNNADFFCAYGERIE